MATTQFTTLNLHATQYRRKIRLNLVQTTIQTTTIQTKSNDFLRKF